LISEIEKIEAFRYLKPKRKEGFLKIISSTAFPTAIAKGFPPKVLPCVPGVIPIDTFFVTKHAPSGNPPPIPLAIGTISGTIPDFSNAKKSPVHPIPHWTSSKIKRRFFSLKKNINPISISTIKTKSLREVGLSRQKILYINNISEFFIQNKKFIKNINKFSEVETREKLISIKGVGEWTTDMFLIFGLGKSNIFPKGDLGFLKAISINYKKNLPLTNNYLNLLFNKWTPYNTLATWYLWRSLDPIPISY